MRNRSLLHPLKWAVFHLILMNVFTVQNLLAHSSATTSTWIQSSSSIIPNSNSVDCPRAPTPKHPHHNLNCLGNGKLGQKSNKHVCRQYHIGNCQNCQQKGLTPYYNKQQKRGLWTSSNVYYDLIKGNPSEAFKAVLGDLKKNVEIISLVSIPGKILLNVIGLFFRSIQDFWVYDTHSTIYKYKTFVSLLLLRRMNQGKLGPENEYIDKFIAVDKFVNFTDYSNFTRPMHLASRNLDNNYIKNIENYLIKGIPLIIILYILLLIIFHCTSDYRISKYFYSFYFKLTLLTLLFDGNLQYLIYTFLNQMSTPFFFGFADKMNIAFCVLFSFPILIYSLASGYICYWFYSKKFKAVFPEYLRFITIIHMIPYLMILRHYLPIAFHYFYNEGQNGLSQKYIGLTIIDLAITFSYFSLSYYFRHQLSLCFFSFSYFVKAVFDFILLINLWYVPMDLTLDPEDETSILFDNILHFLMWATVGIRILPPFVNLFGRFIVCVGNILLNYLEVEKQHENEEDRKIDEDQREILKREQVIGKRKILKKAEGDENGSGSESANQSSVMKSVKYEKSAKSVKSVKYEKSVKYQKSQRSEKSEKSLKNEKNEKNEKSKKQINNEQQVLREQFDANSQKDAFILVGYYGMEQNQNFNPNLTIFQKDKNNPKKGKTIIKCTIYKK